MNKNQKISFFFTLAILLALFYVFFGDRVNLPDLTNFIPKSETAPKEVKTTKRNKKPVDSNVGKPMDSYNGVNVFYNGGVSSVYGRNSTKDGYNLGLKYQCVEFVKRYYYERFGHKMPNSYGHAKEFFNPILSDGQFNTDRGLTQYSNPSYTRPTAESLLVYGPTQYNSFGHVAIVTKVGSNTVECISQNMGKGNGTRRTYALNQTADGRWHISDKYIKGWLSN